MQRFTSKENVWYKLVSSFSLFRENSWRKFDFHVGFLSWHFSPQLPDIPVLEYLRQPFINWINSRGLLLSYECLVLFCKFNYIGISSLIVLQDVPSNAAGEELPFLSKDDCNYYMQGCKTLFYFELNWLEWRHAFFLIKINPNFGRKLSLHHHSLSYEMILLV